MSETNETTNETTNDRRTIDATISRDVIRIDAYERRTRYAYVETNVYARVEYDANASIDDDVIVIDYVVRESSNESIDAISIAIDDTLFDTIVRARRERDAYRIAKIDETIDALNATRSRIENDV